LASLDAYQFLIISLETAENPLSSCLEFVQTLTTPVRPERSRASGEVEGEDPYIQSKTTLGLSVRAES
jgi:hypothetical protein